MSIAATLSLNVPAITALCQGPRGSTTYAASGTPTNIHNIYSGNPGTTGDYYIDTATGLYYGPKTTVWPSTPAFSLTQPVSSYPLILVPGSTTALTIPSSGVNSISLQSSIASVLGGTNNALTGTNSFIIGSNITAAITGFTLVNNLSATGMVFDSAGSSDEWNSAYTYTSTNSAAINSTYSILTANSAGWSNVYSILSATSGSWTSTYSTVSANSGNWSTAYRVVSSLAYQTYTYNAATSSIIPFHGTNFAPGSASNVDGGDLNTAAGCFSSVLGGICNTASGAYSNITGGFSGNALGTYSNVAGGSCNTASGYGSTIGGGVNNIACGYNAVVAAGAYNTSSCCSTFIGGGKFNTASGIRSAVVAGQNNTASGNYSFIAAGSANDTRNLSNTFILGVGLSASQANFTYSNNLSAQNNIYAGGKAGIGTASPSQALTIQNGNALITNSNWGTNINSGALYFGDTLHGISNTYASPLALSGANGISFTVNNGSWVQAVNISSAGNVGIGNTSPTVPLDFGAGIVSTPGQAGIINLRNGAYGFGISPFTLNIVSANSTLFYNNGLSALFINGSGNIGIGTTAPAAPLHINTGVGNYGAIQLGNNVNGQGFTITKEATDNTFNIWTNVVGSGTSRFNIDQSGDVSMAVNGGSVGVGVTTTTSNSKLTVQRTGGNSALADIRTSDGTQWVDINSNIVGGAWNPLTRNSDSSIIYSAGTIDNNSSALVIGPHSSSTKGLRINSNGYVAVNTVSAFAAL